MTTVEVWRARDGARRIAHAPGPTWLRRHYTTGCAPSRPARGRRRRARHPRLRGAGVIRLLPEHSSIL